MIEANSMRKLVESQGGDTRLKNKKRAKVTNKIIHFFFTNKKPPSRIPACVLNRLQNKVLGCYFREPSTRTLCSFQTAMAKLGGSSIVLHEEKSSKMKGETFSDTIRTMSCFCDALVIRHPDRGSAMAASLLSDNKPVINAGNIFIFTLLYPLLCVNKLKSSDGSDEKIQSFLFLTLFDTQISFYFNYFLKKQGMGMESIPHRHC